MSPSTSDSSPLSSAASVETPPGAVVPKKVSKVSKASKVSKVSKVSKEVPTKAGANTYLTPNKNPAPLSPASTKSPASNLSKKRSHTEVDEAEVFTMVNTKRIKKIKPSASTAAAGDSQTSAMVKTKRIIKKANPPASTSTRSSGRARKAPERLSDYKEPQKPKLAPTRKPASKVFDPVYLTTNSNSRLVKLDVFHMLLKPEPWTCLAGEEKLTILSVLPKNFQNEKLTKDLLAGTAAPNQRPREFNLNFTPFRTDVAKFQEDLASGHLAKGWQASAEQAIIERATGAFDDWKDAEAQRWWGQN